ncbi:MAG: NAD(P)/FAD-dependent oxidoreductase [Bacteriovoracia bacterium]
MRQVVVVGAGVVGCAIANEVASSQGYECVVLEKGPRVGEGVSSRNSGVIHAGLYYPPQSLKANLCIEGHKLLIDWCKKKNISHQICGKWIVATKDEIPDLEELFENAKNSGAKGIELSSSKKLAEAFRNNDIKSDQIKAAIFSKNTGVVDAAELTQSLRLSAEQNGAQFIFNAQVKNISKKNGRYAVETLRGDIEADIVTNAAGLYSDVVSNFFGSKKITLHPCRGDYFRIKKKLKFKNLIYPVKKKNSPGLGVHLTIGLDGSLKLGPDTTYVNSKEDFSDPQDLDAKRVLFFESASRLIQGIQLEDLEYDSCGIRPKLRSRDEKNEKDFIISQDHPGFFNCVGIESPGLTAALAIAKYIRKQLKTT